MKAPTTAPNGETDPGERGGVAASVAANSGELLVPRALQGRRIVMKYGESP